MAFVPDKNPRPSGRFVPDDEVDNRTAGDVAVDLAKGLGGAAISAVGAVPTAAGRLVQEGGEKLFGMTMDEARRLAESEGTPEKAAEWYEKSNRLNPASIAGRGIEAAGQWISRQGDSIRDSRSPQAKEKARQSTPDGDLTQPDTWTMGENPSVEGVAHVLADVTGSMAPPVAAAIATRGKSAATQMQVGGAVTAGQIAGGAIDETTQYLGQFDDAKLRSMSPVFRDLEAKGYSPADARQFLLREAQNRAAAYAAPVGYAGGKATGALLGKPGEKIAHAINNTAVKAAVLAALGASEEGLQEVGEGVATRAGINDATGMTRPLTEGTFGEFVLGAKGGGTMAGGKVLVDRALQGATGSEDRSASPAPSQAPAPEPSSAQNYPDAVSRGTQAQAEPTEAERALREPASLTALDRVGEITKEQVRLQERLAELSDPAGGYGQMFDQERQDLAQRAQALAAERDQLTANWPKAEPGQTTSFTTEAGARLEGQYALMDIDALVTSHDANLRQNPDYPQELQPRARDRAASEMQISGIVGKLDPARLGLSADAGTGAPIVGADGLVESGNARTIALKRVYQANGQKAADYRQFLIDNAAQFGLTPEQIQGMDKPVLVRVRSTPVNRAEFARQANASTVAAMSPSEQAKSDAARIDSMEDLRPDEQGDFQTSREFIRRFMSRLPMTEQAGMVDAGGALSAAGYARVRNAVLAKAYGDSAVLMRMVESMDDNLRNVSKALMSAAPKVAQMRQAVAAGQRFDADITPDLMAAVEELSRLKDEGVSVQDALAQAGMFGEKYSQETRDLLQFLADNIRRPRRMADFIVAYMDALDAAGDPNQGSLLGDTEAPAKADLLAAAGRTVQGDSDAQGSDAAREAGQDPGPGADGRGQPENATGDQGRAQGDGSTAEAGTESEWVAFAPDTGTLGIPRAEMPQVRNKDRGALINFLEARGIAHESDRVPASSLKPTQAEYSRNKVDKFVETGAIGERSVLISSDGHVLDGHHQWLGHRERGEEINVIRLDAPIRELLEVVNAFPGVKRSEGAADIKQLRAAAVQDFKDALADLAQIASKHTRAAMIPEDTPGLKPALVKLFASAFKIVGTDMRAATRWVREQLRANEATKKIANFIKNATMEEAAREALAQVEKEGAPQGGLFDSIDQANEALQGDLFGAQSAPSLPEPVKVAKIDGRAYDMKRDNFVPPHINDFLAPDVIQEAESYVDRYYKNKPDPAISAADQARAEDQLRSLVKRAEDVKPTYDQKIIDIAKRVGAMGQMIAPVKGMARAVLKLVLEEQFNVDGMKDMLRSTIVVSDYRQAQAVLDEIAKEFELTRKPKNRTGNTPLTFNGQTIEPENPANYGGYSDVMVNVRMPNGVIAEIQINVPEMLGAKEGPDRQAPGHKLYEAYREAPKESPLGQEIKQAMLGYYAAALAAASSRNAADSAKNSASVRSHHSLMGPRAPSEGRGSSDAPSDDMANQPRPGISTKNPPSVRSANRQPAGNLSGTGIDITSPLDKSVSQLPANGYTGGDLFGENDATVQPSAGSTQAQSAGSAQETGDGGDVARVRPGSGGRDQQRSGNADAGAADPREVGQAGADGVRGQDAAGRPDEPRNRAGRSAGVPAGRDIPAKSGRNYRFGADDLTYSGSWLKKAEQNVEAVELLRALEKEGRQATAEEQAKLAKFIGWGSSDLANNLFGKKLDKAAESLQGYERALASMDALKRDWLNKGGQYRGSYADNGYYDAVSVLRNAGKLGVHDYPIKVTRSDLDSVKPDASTKKWLALRDRLRAAMTTDELAEASRSTQYAHYTSKAVVSSMWKAMERMGFKGGTILEPGAGIGVFPGLMPEAMAANSIYTGVEFDSITGGVLKQLFPDERILVESFVDSKLPKNFYDVAIGNPPFSGTKILGDPEYAKRALSLHDYFFAKSIDRVKPGGLVVYVTSRYTMDKIDDKARAYLAERADLVGAIRLPQTAFKQNAGTEVVTDVIFLRKKVPGETFDGAQAWAKAGEIKGKDGKTLMVKDQHGTEKPAMVNEYFAAHPEMVLGEHANTGSMYSDQEYTVMPLEGDIEAHFAKAVENLPADIYQPARGSSAEAAKVREIDFNPNAKKEGNYYVSDKGALMIREGGVGVPVELKSQKDVELIKDFVPLRDALKQAHYDQLNDGSWEASLKALQDAYAKFTKKHGQVNQFTTRIIKSKVVDEDTGETYTDETPIRSFPLLEKLRDDPDYTLVAALETINDDTGEIKPSNFLTDRVLGKPQAAELATPSDALLSSLNDVGHVDIGLIAGRLGLSEGETIEALGSAVYEDPESGWTTADDYLSGNVKRKLEAAREAAKADRRFERNVQALEAAQPAPKTPSQINVGLGMNWVPGSDYAQFLRDIAGVRATVEWNARTKQWIVQEQGGGRTMAATADWGTAERNATEILEHALTGRPIRVTQSVGTGSDRKTVFNASATEAANQKLDAMRERFSSWVWEDAERTDRLVRIYNDTFNTTVPRSFDGSHLTLPGTSKAFQVFDHVKRGAWRIIQRGNTYLAHAVGSGKTFQMVIAAMEQKRLGLIKKPMVVVPNHMLKQFAHEWQQLYPAARLMVADENNFHTENRRRFVSRVALSDLDGVVITHSAFKLLDLDPEFKSKIIEEQLDVMRAALEEAESDEGNGSKKSPRIKQIEKQIENLEQKLEAALSSVGKDQNVRFDELGVDFLMVDEAHEFRKLDFATSRQVKGISPQGSARALDLYIKARYLEEKNPGRSLVMASGTPVTNTLAELYTVQKFMDRQAMIDKNIDDFDSWASMFGRERTVLEPNAAGKYEPVTRFSKFVNVPELTQMFREFADVLTADHLAALLGDKRPKVEGGARKIIVTPKGRDYTLYQRELESRVAASKNWKPSKDEPNNPDPIIKIIGDGRLAAIDMRFIWPDTPSDPDSKLNRMIDDVIATYKATSDMEFSDKAGKVEPNNGAAMMVFSDLGFGAGVAASRGFNARAWFEKRLRDAGVPLAQVAFMSDYKKSADKLKLFKDVNAGRVRILIGSSKNMGTGVNAQQRLKALFHLDSPWYPADLEQREGRIIRQGNKNRLVQIFAYAAKGTYDENMWKMLASKQYFIDQALSGDENIRELEDLDSQSQYDLAAAMVAEDPRIMQLAGAKAEIEKLNRLYQAHEDQRFRFRRQFEQAQLTVEFNEKRLPAAQEAAKLAQDLSGDNFKAKALGKTYTDRNEWAGALMEKFKDLSAAVESKTVTLGEISGFKIEYTPETIGTEFRPKAMLLTADPIILFMDPSDPLAGIAMRAQNAVAEVARLPAKMRERITEARAQMDALQTRLEAPFPMAGMLADKVKEAADLSAAIEADSKKAEQPDTDAPAEDGAAEPNLSRGTGAGGMAMRDLEAVVARVSKGLKNLPKVHVFASPADLSNKVPDQKSLRDFIKKQGAMADAEGGMHNGEIYLFASGLADEARAEHVLAVHEITHYGLRGAMGKDLDAALQHIWVNNAAIRKEAAAVRQRLGLPSNVEAVEEVLAEIPSSELAKLKGWRRVVKVARDWFNRIGATSMAARLDQWLQAGMDDQARADLFVADLLTAAREWVRTGRGGRGGSMADVTRLSSLAEDAEKQEKWLTAEAKARGYKDIEDLLEKNYSVFEKLAAKWREMNPATDGVMLSRAPQRGTAAERADKILTTKAGSRAPLDYLARTLTRVTGVERLTGAIYRKAGYLLDKYTPEQIKAGVVADYGVPEAVIDQRAMMQGRQRVQLRKAGAMIEKLSTLTRAESRVAYEWMNMDGQDPKAYLSMMEGLPEESVKVLQEVQQLIDKLSREAVALGQLSQDAYERNRMAYLRRSYAKHVLEQDAGEKAKRSRVISILGDQYKGRGLTEAAAMNKVAAVAPEWWGRKLRAGKADAGLKGEKFVRLERRAPAGAGTQALPGMTGRPEGRLLEVAYYPAGQALPTQFKDWEQAGTFEVRDVKGPNLILWRDFTKEEREQMGEVDEARFAIAKTLHGMIHDVEVGRYLEWVGYTYAKKEGEQIPGTVVEASERYRDTFAPNEWVQVPDSKIPGTQVAKYGKLAGRYIPGPIWNDLRQVVGGQFKPFGDTYAKILTMWKTAKTALSPAVHMNNVMSNFVMADWHDVGAAHVAKSLRLILAASQRQGTGLIGRTGNILARAGIADREAARELLNRYKDSGGDIGSWVTNEIARDQLEPLLASLEKELAATAGASQQAQVGVYAAMQHALMLRFPSAWEAFKGGKVGKAAVTEAQSLIDLYQAEDDIFRLAAWLKAKEDGKSDLEAGRAARSSFLDYHINAPWIQMMRSTAWPFISFTYRAVPMMLETAAKKPHKLLKLMMIAGGLNALGAMLAGGDDEEERKLLPEEKAGKIWGMVPKLVRMPWNDLNGHPVYLDIRRFIPVGDVFDVGQGHSAVPILPGLQPGGPMALAAEVVVNRSMFTGKPITLDTDTASQKAAKLGDYLYKAFAPNVLGLPGTYATTATVDAAKGKTDAFGRQQSVAQAAASAFGVKLGSYPADVLKLNLTRKAQAELMEIDRNITLLKRQRMTNQIDQAEFEKLVKVEQEKQRKVIEKVREKVE